MSEDREPLSLEDMGEPPLTAEEMWDRLAEALERIATVLENFGETIETAPDGRKFVRTESAK